MTFKQLLASISKQEWRWVLITAIVLIVLTSAPYVYGYLNTPPNTFYNGLHSLTPGDFFVYFSYINQVKEGSWLLYDHFTSEPQGAGIFNLVWFSIGLLARILNISAPVIFQLTRILLLPVFLSVLYIFIAYFFAEKSKRFTAFLFSCFASGIGAYFAMGYEKSLIASLDSDIYKWPIDLWIPESNIFLTLYHSPLLEVSWIMMMLSFLIYLLALKNNKYYYSALAGILALVWFNFHPYYLPYFFLIILVYSVIYVLINKKWRLFGHFLLCLAISLPSFFYHYYLLSTDYIIGTRAGQNITPSSPFIFIFLGFGFLLVTAVFGLYYQFKNRELFKNDKIIFLAVWLVCGFVLIYSPITFQRRFIEGLQLPLVFFTILGIWGIKDYLKLKLPKLFQFLNGNYVFLCFMFLILFGFSTLFNLVRDNLYFHGKYFKFYTSVEYRQAADWLSANNHDRNAIFSHDYNGWFLPALTNSTPIFIGHKHETIKYSEKESIMKDIGNDLYDEQAVRDIFAAYNVQYFFYSNIERTFFRYKPETKPYLEKVWQGEEVEIYKVK